MDIEWICKKKRLNFILDEKFRDFLINLYKFHYKFYINFI